jgi:hypothetical protein
MEEPAVPVGPLHHRGDTEFSVQVIHFISITATAEVGKSIEPTAQTRALRCCPELAHLGPNQRRLEGIPSFSRPCGAPFSRHRIARQPHRRARTPEHKSLKNLTAAAIAP